jgi:hypothetical protein
VKRRRRLRKLRTLVPDPELIRRRAAGEPLRALAVDYDVSHTTLGRYFQRPELARQVKPAANTKTRRRLRRLAPDPELIRRRAAGERLRELALDYGVAHTTLGRYFERPEVAKQVKQAAKQLRADAARRSAERRRLEREARSKAREQAAAERKQARRLRAAERESVSRRRRADGSYAAWLDERDARQPLTRADLHSRADGIAARAVAAGGGIQAVVEATGLRMLENVVRLIDPAILKRALDNDSLDEKKRRPPS